MNNLHSIRSSTWLDFGIKNRSTPHLKTLKNVNVSVGRFSIHFLSILEAFEEPIGGSGGALLESKSKSTVRGIAIL